MWNLKAFNAPESTAQMSQSTLGITQVAIIHAGIYTPINTLWGMAAIAKTSHLRMMPIRFMKIARTIMILIVAASARAFSPRET